MWTIFEGVYFCLSKIARQALERNDPKLLDFCTIFVVFAKVLVIAVYVTFYYYKSLISNIKTLLKKIYKLHKFFIEITQNGVITYFFGISNGKSFIQDFKFQTFLFNKSLKILKKYQNFQKRPEIISLSDFYEDFMDFIYFLQ